jgi:phosphoglycerate dehydrogenase-like enzyme
LGIGTDFIDCDAATERNILVAYGATEENISSVAEATVLLMLALLYDLRTAEMACANPAARVSRQARMLKGSIVGLVGFGPIAQAVARRLSAWDVELIVHARRVDEAFGVTSVSLEELLERSDVVSLHMALSPNTMGLIGPEQLIRMKPGAILINTARGELIQEAALLAALDSGRIAAAGLDVFQVEPPSPSHPLLRSPKVIATPHILAQTRQAIDAAPRLALESLLRIARGEVPKAVRNPEVLPRWRAPCK